MLIFIVVKPGAQYVAILFAPVSLVAPLASVAILLNAVLVPWCRGERLSRRDLWIGAILVSGCIGAMMSGPRSTKFWSFSELSDFAMESCGFTISLLSVLVMLTVRLYFVWSCADRQPHLCIEPEVAASQQRLEVALAALVPSIASAFNNVVAKVLMDGFLSGPELFLIPLVGALACTAFLQVWSTSVGAQLFDMLVYVPVQVALQILVTVTYGAVFFKEGPSNPAAFVACTLAIGQGVLLSQSRPAECDGYKALADGPDDQKQGCGNIQTPDSVCMGA